MILPDYFFPQLDVDIRINEHRAALKKAG